MFILQCIHQYFFPRKKWEVEHLGPFFQKVTFKKISAFCNPHFLTCCCSSGHASRYASQLHTQPRFPALLKPCLEGLSPPPHCGKVAKRLSWRGEEVVLPPSHLSPQDPCRSRDTHLITRHAKWWTEGFMPLCRRGKTVLPKRKWGGDLKAFTASTRFPIWSHRTDILGRDLEKEK